MPVCKKCEANKRARERRRLAKSPNIEIENEGSLTSVGYRMVENASKREKALARAVKKYGYGTTMRKVNALYVLNKKRPLLRRKAQVDKEFLKKRFGK